MRYVWRLPYVGATASIAGVIAFFVNDDAAWLLIGLGGLASGIYGFRERRESGPPERWRGD